MKKDSIKFIMKYIKLNNVHKVLEIGTAIGYSAILMATAAEDVEVTTIERDKDRYDIAIKVNKYIAKYQNQLPTTVQTIPQEQILDFAYYN